jgi:hypothetical protein
MTAHRRRHHHRRQTFRIDLSAAAAASVGHTVAEDKPAAGDTLRTAADSSAVAHPNYPAGVADSRVAENTVAAGSCWRAGTGYFLSQTQEEGQEEGSAIVAGVGWKGRRWGLPIDHRSFSP